MRFEDYIPKNNNAVEEHSNGTYLTGRTPDIEDQNISPDKNSDESFTDINYAPNLSDLSSDEAQSNKENVTKDAVKKDSFSLGRQKQERKKYEGQDRKIRKIKANSNEAYYSARGKLVQPKQFVEFVCTCYEML